LATAGLGHCLERRSASGNLRTRVHADRRLDAWRNATDDQRGLPLPQYLETREESRREAGGDGLHPWRRLFQRRGGHAAVLGRRTGRKGWSLSPSVSARPFRLPVSAGAHARIGRTSLRQLWTSGSDSGSRVGAPQHRRLWRRCRPGDDLWPVGGRDVGKPADVNAPGQGLFERAIGEAAVSSSPCNSRRTGFWPGPSARAWPTPRQWAPARWLNFAPCRRRS